VVLYAPPSLNTSKKKVFVIYKCIFWIGAIGIGKLYQSEKICGVCYSSSTHGICSTVNCTHENIKNSSDDMVEIVSFDLAEQLKVLINK
jgi:hypothetical protein